MGQNGGSRNGKTQAGGLGLSGLLFHLLLHALAEPLLHHALVVQVAAAGDTLDAAEHARIETQGDGGGLAHVTAMQGGLHEALVELVRGPEVDLGVLGVEFGHVFPQADDFEIWGEGGHGGGGSNVLGLFALEEVMLGGGHSAGVDDAVALAIGPENAEHRMPLEGLSEVVVTRLGTRALLIGHQFERKGVLEGFLDVLRRKGREVKGTANPVKVHVVRARRVIYGIR